MLPSLTSDAVAEQLSVEPTTTFEVGEMLMLEMDGAVLDTVTLADDVAEAELESVAVDVQVMVSPTLASEALTMYVLPLPTLDEPTLQA